MRCIRSVVAAAVLAAATPSHAYSVTDSFEDARRCTEPDYTFPPNVIAACTRLIENVKTLSPAMQDNLGFYYLFRAVHIKPREKSCADVTTALQLMPKARRQKPALVEAAKRLRESTC